MFRLDSSVICWHSGRSWTLDELTERVGAPFDRAPGARIYTLNLFDELTAHGSGTSDLTRLCDLVLAGRLDSQVEREGSWREPGPAIDALVQRRTGGNVVLHVD